MTSTSTPRSDATVPPLPLIDRFEVDATRGRVVGSTAATGHRRHGEDVERVLSIDHGALRISPLTAPDWGRSSVRYGPWTLHDGLVLAVTITNGRNGSENLEAWPTWTEWLKQWVRGTQCDPPPARMLAALRRPRRDGLVRRLRAARHDASLTEADRSDLNLAVGWVEDPRRPLDGVAFVVRSRGGENADLCLTDSGRVRSLLPLDELPMHLVLTCEGGSITAAAAVDDGSGRWPSPTVLAVVERSPTVPMWATIDQRVLGQVGWSMDTRVAHVRVGHLDHSAQDTPGEVATVDLPSTVRPCGDRDVFSDDFADRREYQRDRDEVRDGEGADESADGAHPADLGNRVHDGTRWRRVAGQRPILLDGSSAVVGALLPEPHGVSRLLQPSGQRAAYVVDWQGGDGDVAVEITPPGERRGQGQRGRGGLVLYEDEHNYLIVNNWLDDGYPGASVSVFRRARGFEEVYDAVWVNVGGRITWGRPHTLGVSFDDTGFTARLDGAPVLTRHHHDIYPTEAPLRVRAVGICANWEFGDDTGSRFRRFTARRVQRR